MFITISGYEFVPLADLAEVQLRLHEQCQSLALKGTILLSPEGININLAGMPSDIDHFIAFLHKEVRFQNITFHRLETKNLPFLHLKVKIKKEIITMKAPDIHPEKKRAPAISPEEFKQWLDEERDITIVDTRNEFETWFGTFKNAVNLGMNKFSEFGEVAKTLDPEKPVVMFCTGGIRCEKAALHLQQKGFKQVYQLQNGILGYFKKVGGAYYDGECFVFDERVAVTPELQVSGAKQCKVCYGPVREMHECVQASGELGS